MDQAYQFVSEFETISIPYHSIQLVDTVTNFEGFDYYTYRITESIVADAPGFISGLKLRTPHDYLTALHFNEAGIPNQDVIAGDTIEIEYNIQVGMPHTPIHLAQLQTSESPDIMLTIEPVVLHSRSKYSDFRQPMDDPMDSNKVYLEFKTSIGDIMRIATLTDNGNQAFINDMINGELININYVNTGASDITVNGVYVGFNSAKGFGEVYKINLSEPILLHQDGYIDLDVTFDVNNQSGAFASMRVQVVSDDNPQSPLSDIEVVVRDTNDQILVTRNTDTEGFIYVGGLQYGQLIKLQASDGVITTPEYGIYVNQTHIPLTMVLK